MAPEIREADLDAAISVLITNVVVTGLQAHPMGWSVSTSEDGRVSINVIGRRLPEAKAA